MIGDSVEMDQLDRLGMDGWEGVWSLGEKEGREKREMEDELA